VVAILVQSPAALVALREARPALSLPVVMAMLSMVA
jgi:hypothetical protein